MERIDALTPSDLWPPDITPFAAGNTGIPYVWRFDAAEPGPHVAVNALMHGNEVCGAKALIALLEADIRPQCGSLSVSFANIDAFARFNPRYPHLSRFADEDMNRIWSPEILVDSPRGTAERRRAHVLWPHFGSVDFLLDLHSMQHDSTPLMLAGKTAKGQALARQVGLPAIIVADSGHADGRRLIDHPRFVDDPTAGPVALLAECGRHEDPVSADVALAVTARFLEVTGVVATEALTAWLPATPLPPTRLLDITDVVTVRDDSFRFTGDIAGLDVIATQGTVFAEEAGEELRTPYDHCVMIMPTRQPVVGHTAVRLGRFVA